MSDDKKRNVGLGTFDTQIEAARARDRAVRQHKDEGAVQEFNFPEKGEKVNLSVKDSQRI